MGLGTNSVLRVTRWDATCILLGYCRHQSIYSFQREWEVQVIQGS